MEGTDPRRAAFKVLRRVEREGAYSTLLLQHLEETGRDRRDVALATELVYGVLRRRLYLDHVVSRFSKRPLEKIDADLLLTLRLALYQILFLDRIPLHAAVNEAVEMARGEGGGRGEAAASFANGLLRAVARDPSSRSSAQKKTVLPGVDLGDPVAELATAESHPEWLVRRWAARLGIEEAALLLAAQNRPAPMALRVNRARETPAQVTEALAEESVIACSSSRQESFLLVTSGAPQRTASFTRGEFYIQDEASGLVACMMGAAPGDKVLDACAAPGGKALAMAQTAGRAGMVVAMDRHPGRLRLLNDNARRLGLSGCLPVAADASADELPLRAAEVFDAVLVDAPCSGTGVIRRNPELRYRVSPRDIERLADLQSRLLQRCAGRVRPGGALVYSVCSLEPEEGEEGVAAFLEGDPRFVLEDPRPMLPESARDLVRSTKLGPCLITWPHLDDLDGFFAARMKRQR